MFCPKCGKKNDDNSLFCTWCGAGFGSVSTQSLSAAPAAPDSAANLLSFNNEVPVASAQKPEKERRYFTAAHIAICLAVTGVMAAAAGIFAGLYFSTIL